MEKVYQIEIQDWDSPLVGLKTENFTMRQVALKAATSKLVKHEITYSDNQRTIILFAFHTFGFLDYGSSVKSLKDHA
jgi:hypothetical protein